VSAFLANAGRIIQVSSGLLTPVIAVIAVYIAYQQHLTSRRQHRLALFQQRLAVFNATKKLLLSIVADASVDLNQLREFSSDTSQHLFLFGQDIEMYVRELYKNALDYRGLHRKPSPEDDTQLLLRFTDDLVNLESRFLPYMDFRKP
jgi:hypothetical protein